MRAPHEHQRRLRRRLHDPRFAFGPLGPDPRGGHHTDHDDIDQEDAMTPPFPPFPPGPAFRGGPHGHGRHGRRGPGGRQRRGDVRAALLALLAERPMHGYEMIKEIDERSSGFWKPSPGSVYPTLQLLADEGLVRSLDGDSGKRLFELTDEGRAEAERAATVPPWEQVTADVDPNEVNLRGASGQLLQAVMGVSQAGSPQQKARAVDVINEARRQLYAILGEADGS